MSEQLFKDEMLTWLCERKQAINLTLKYEQDPTLIGILKGQLDSYLQTIAFIMSDGRLR